MIPWRVLEHSKLLRCALLGSGGSVMVACAQNCLFELFAVFVFEFPARTVICSTVRLDHQ